MVTDYIHFIYFLPSCSQYGKTWFLTPEWYLFPTHWTAGNLFHLAHAGDYLKNHAFKTNNFLLKSLALCDNHDLKMIPMVSLSILSSCEYFLKFM